jgi:cyclophilin family peptidyl-prolyl cis-trans isomerase
MRIGSLFCGILVVLSCSNPPKSNTVSSSSSVEGSATALPSESQKAAEMESEEKGENETFVLDEENAIPFFFEYQKKLNERFVTFETSMGEFTVELFEDVPYHRANLIYLAKKGYFNGTQFHRVVKDFIIQGGNTDNREIARRRVSIGRYLLPPDADKGHSHHRGVISMPSSDINNPHKLASPYEFFIVVKRPGSYHLDGNYTAFGTVVEGMDVVDAINKVEVDQGDWPTKNVYILKATAH